MFVPFYQEKTTLDIAAELFTDVAWVAGYVIGFAIALYQHFIATQDSGDTGFVAPSQKDLSRDDLRAMCKYAGIRWNRAGEGGKHLTKAEMIVRLTEAKVCNI